MAKTATKEVSWYAAAADLIVRKRIDVFQATVLLNQMMTREEAEKHFDTDAFQRVLRAARNKWFSDQANDPGHNKRSLIGKLLLAAEALMERSPDKAAEVLHKIAKIEGWDKSGESITVIGDLTQQDLDEIRRKFTVDSFQDIKSTSRVN